MNKVYFWLFLVLIITIAIFLAFWITGREELIPVDDAPPQEFYNDQHNARNALDYAGTYNGILPCADCEGILTIIELTYEGTYQKNVIYLGKGEEEVYESHGNFVWSEDGNKITLQGTEWANKYFVSENYLVQLDNDGNKITGDLADKYILRKVNLEE